MKAIFTDPYTKKERYLNTEGQPWGGETYNIFINAVDEETREEGTYCTSEVYIKIPLLRLLTISSLLRI